VQAGEQLTAVRFDDTGLGCAVGTSGGLVALFDLRAQKPLVVKDHMNGQRITDIKFHAAGHDGSTGNSRFVHFVVQFVLYFFPWEMSAPSKSAPGSSMHCVPLGVCCQPWM